MAEPPTLSQVVSPSSLLKTRIYKHFTEDGQLAEHEDLHVKPLSFHQSITASTYDSAEKHPDTAPGIGLGR